MKLSKKTKHNPNLTMWCQVKINCRSAATLQMSLCLPRWSLLHFSHSLWPLFHHSSPYLLSLMNAYFQTNFNTSLNAHIALNVR